MHLLQPIIPLDECAQIEALYSKYFGFWKTPQSPSAWAIPSAIFFGPTTMYPGGGRVRKGLSRRATGISQASMTTSNRESPAAKKSGVSLSRSRRKNSKPPKCPQKESAAALTTAIPPMFFCVGESIESSAIHSIFFRRRFAQRRKGGGFVRINNQQQASGGGKFHHGGRLRPMRRNRLQSRFAGGINLMRSRNHLGSRNQNVLGSRSHLGNSPMLFLPSILSAIDRSRR